MILAVCLMVFQLAKDEKPNVEIVVEKRDSLVVNIYTSPYGTECSLFPSIRDILPVM